MATVTTVFTTINGMLVHEDRGGVETEYVSDPLGSLVQTRNSSGTKTYDAQYWPYGELQTSTGTNPSSWGFVGLLGYLTDSANVFYVRSRYLMAKFARWLTVDPLWPREKAFGYVSDRPIDLKDPSGLDSTSCDQGLSFQNTLCQAAFGTCIIRAGIFLLSCKSGCAISCLFSPLTCALCWLACIAMAAVWLALCALGLKLCMEIAFLNYCICESERQKGVLEPVLPSGCMFLTKTKNENPQ
jgi:RHS repeat-associated protein